MSKAVGIDEGDGVVTWHAPGIGPSDYATLCGLDGNDSKVGQYGVVRPKRGQRIDCPQCRIIWQETLALKLTKRSFYVTTQLNDTAT